MKKEKMKRVAVLALAGTIAVGTVSPAAFADEGEQVEQQEVDSVPLEQPSKTQPNGAIDEVVWGGSEVKEEGKEETVGVVNPSVSRNEDGTDPGFVMDNDGVVVKTEETDGNTTTVAVETPEDEPLTEEVLTPVPEEPEDGADLSEEEKELVEDAGEVEDGIEDALTNPADPADPTGTTDTNDKVEGALEDELEKEDQDLAGAQQDAIEDALEVDEETGKGSVTVTDGEGNETEFDTEIVGTDVSESDTTPVDGQGEPNTDITEETTTTVTTTIKLTPNELTESEDGKVNPKELGELLGENIDTSKEPVVDSEAGTITYTTTDGKTITVTKDESSLETGTGWIATITSEVVQGKGEAEVEDTISVDKGSLDKEWGSNPPKPMDGDTSGEDGETTWAEEDLGLTTEDLEKILNENYSDQTITIGDKTYNVTKDPFHDNFVLTPADDNTVSYTISTIKKLTNVSYTDEELKALSNEELREMLGTDYRKGEDGKIYYTEPDGSEHEITLQGGTVGRDMAITIIKTDTHGAESEVKTDGIWTGLPVSGDAIEWKDELLQEKEKNQALEALQNKLQDSTIEGVDLKDAEWSYCNGTWTAIKDGKTFTFNIAAGTGSDLEDVLGDQENWEDGTGDKSHTADVTVTGDAWVESGTIQWDDKFVEYGDADTDEGEYSENFADNFENGKLTLDDGAKLPTTPDVATDYSNSGVTFNGEKVLSVTVDDQGRIIELVTAGSAIEALKGPGGGHDGPGCGGGASDDETASTQKTYTFDYTVTEQEKSDQENELEGEIIGDEVVNTDVTINTMNTLKWTIKTETITEKKADEELGEGISVSEGNGGSAKVEDWYGEGEDLTLYENWDGTYRDGAMTSSDATYTIHEENLTADDVKNLLVQNSYVNSEKQQEITVDTTNKTAAYTDDDGREITLSYSNATKVTVTKEEKENLCATVDKDGNAAWAEESEETISELLDGVAKGEYEIKEYNDYLDDLKEGEQASSAGFANWLVNTQTHNNQNLSVETEKDAEPAFQTSASAPAGLRDQGDASSYGYGGYLPSWEQKVSLTVTKITQKEGSSLTVDSLVTKKKDSEVDGSRTEGSYHVAQNLKVSNDPDNAAFADAKGNAVYAAEQQTDTYEVCKTWETTKEIYSADGVQYGETIDWCGWIPHKNGDVSLGFEYQEVTTEVKVTHKMEIAEREIELEATITTPTQPGGSEGGEENPGEQPEGPALILTDLPVVEEIAETEAPLTAAPEETVIDEEEIPLTDAPAVEKIADEDVAKSAVPRTGDESGIFLLMSTVSGMALTALSFIDRKGRHARFGSRH